MAERMRVKTGRARPVVQLSVPMLVGLVMTSVDSAAPQAGPASQTPSATPDSRPNYQIQPIGWIREVDGRTTIELYDEYRPALLGVDALDSIWVFYWFDRNDTPAQRAILQVHPRCNPENPLRGVFATRAAVRPNLIALSRCRVLSVEGSTIVIEGIDAFADTPVLDIKP
jgi:tRNA (adenine37-N6)-methyltransferase